MKIIIVLLFAFAASVSPLDSFVLAQDANPPAQQQPFKQKEVKINDPKEAQDRTLEKNRARNGKAEKRICRR